MNGINGNHGTWNKEKVSIECEAADMTECILNLLLEALRKVWRQKDLMQC